MEIHLENIDKCDNSFIIHHLIIIIIKHLKQILMLEVSIIQKLLLQSIHIFNLIFISKVKFLNFGKSLNQFDKHINIYI